MGTVKIFTQEDLDKENSKILKERRERVAIASLSGLLANPGIADRGYFVEPGDLVTMALEATDELIAKLDGE